MKDVIRRSALLVEKNIPFAFVSIVESNGSAPRHHGKMLVEQNGEITGTIGGGPLELQATNKAVESIKTGYSHLFNYTLDMAKEDGVQMLCGGDVLLFIEIVSLVPELVIIGAGHVGQAVSKQCDLLGYQYHIADERENLENNFPNALSFNYGENIKEAISKVDIGINSYVVIFTSNDDENALEEVINKKCAYIGMIGSSQKIGAVFNNLKNKGIDLEKLKQVHTPIGISIKAETPGEIAVSILAQIIEIFRSKS